MSAPRIDTKVLSTTRILDRARNITAPGKQLRRDVGRPLGGTDNSRASVAGGKLLPGSASSGCSIRARRFQNRQLAAFDLYDGGAGAG